jgi:hypothetical protein
VDSTSSSDPSLHSTVIAGDAELRPSKTLMTSARFRQLQQGDGSLGGLTAIYLTSTAVNAPLLPNKLKGSTM